MEPKDLALEAIEDLYLGFVESLRDAFVAAITDVNAGIAQSIPTHFYQNSQIRSVRYFALINHIVSAHAKSGSVEELERFSKLIKFYIDDDLQKARKNAQQFALRVKLLQRTKGMTLREALAKERERLFSDDRIYGLKDLGKLSSRITR